MSRIGPPYPLPSTSLQRNALGSRFGLAVPRYLSRLVGEGTGASSRARTSSAPCPAERSSQQHEGARSPPRRLFSLCHVLQHYPGLLNIFHFKIFPQFLITMPAFSWSFQK